MAFTIIYTLRAEGFQAALASKLKIMYMKKIMAVALALALAFTAGSQEIPERKHEGHRPHGGPGGMHHRHPGMALKQLDLTEAQKEQMKAHRENFRKQFEELKKNDNITVKEWKTRMETLRKEQKAGIHQILTTDQKARLEKMRSEGKARHAEMMKQRAERMSKHLGLSADQSGRMEKSRKEAAEKMKSIRENKSLSEEKKREEMKEVMKKQREQIKSILTEEQLKKMKQERHHGPHKGDKKHGMNQETI